MLRTLSAMGSWNLSRTRSLQTPSRLRRSSLRGRWRTLVLIEGRDVKRQVDSAVMLGTSLLSTLKTEGSKAFPQGRRRMGNSYK